MAIPNSSDLLHDGTPRNSTDWDNIVNRTVTYLTIDSDVTFGSITATTYNNLPGFNITGILSGEGLTKGDVARLKISDGKIHKATSASLEGITNVLGIVSESVNSGEIVTIITSTFTEFVGLTVGATHYVGTAGSLTLTPGLNARVIGRALTSTDLLITQETLNYGAININGNFSLRTITIDNTDSPYAVLNESRILANASAGAITINLPTAVGIVGREIQILKTDSSSNEITIDGDGAETIDGNITAALISQGNFITIVSDGTNWAVINRYTKKTIDIGDWNMDSTTTLFVAHGLADFTKIRSVIAIIRNDADTIYNDLIKADEATFLDFQGFIRDIDTTNVQLARTTGGDFDAPAYNSTSFNRGFVELDFSLI